jgi:hypothetical protein
MENQSFTTTILVEQTASQVFNAIIHPEAWWSEDITGGTSNIDDIFDYHFEDIHRTKMKLTEVVPDKKVVWLVLENYFKPSLFNGVDKPAKKDGLGNDKAEWVDTHVIFEIIEKDGKTLLSFKHDGLVPDYECYDICVNGWSHYIQDSLYNLITTGKGQPNATDRPMTTDEEKFKSAVSNA